MPAPRDRSPESAGSTELVHRAQIGSRDAREELFRRYYGRVRRVVRSRMGSRPPLCIESQDVIQETFQAAVVHLDRYEVRGGGALIAWLTRIAENTLRTAARRARAEKRDRRREVPLHGRAETASRSGATIQLSNHTTLPVDRLARGEEAALVRRCLEHLPPRYRRVIQLRLEGDRPWKSIARELGSPSPAAAQMCHCRAVAELVATVHRYRAARSRRGPAAESRR